MINLSRVRLLSEKIGRQLLELNGGTFGGCVPLVLLSLLPITEKYTRILPYPLDGLWAC